MSYRSKIWSNTLWLPWPFSTANGPAKSWAWRWANTPTIASQAASLRLPLVFPRLKASRLAWFSVKVHFPSQNEPEKDKPKELEEDIPKEPEEDKLKEPEENNEEFSESVDQEVKASTLSKFIRFTYIKFYTNINESFCLAWKANLIGNHVVECTISYRYKIPRRFIMHFLPISCGTFYLYYR